ncbi:HSP20-like chaperone,PIH1 domain [Cinara cedri]|uniref:HSP20-like chaperone,PIH1 domain n=1 Tax=Cinara cedri TaxID=506608 RepID=A0A5E4NFA8_9HEMI|nr:HSP20-like chaperone,PIH1 domain [Cinara cedri]
MDFIDMKKLSEILSPPKDDSSDSESDLPKTSLIQLCKSKTGKDTKIVSKETIKNEKKCEKIEVIQSEEEKAKNIWLEEEVVAAPIAIDVVSDTRTRPDYNVKYQQYVGTEDVFLQMGPKTPLTSSCEAMIIEVKMPGDRMPGICTDVTDDSVDVRSPKYRLHVPFPHNVHKQVSKAQWNSSTETLTITVFLKREFDAINF